MATTTLNFISRRPIFVTTKDPNTQRPVYPESRDWVSLYFFAFTKRRVLYRDRHGALHLIREHGAALAPTRERRFHASWLGQPDAVGSILCGALGIEQIDRDSARRFAEGVLECVGETGSLDLIASFEVICSDIVVGREEELVEDLAGTECLICLEDLWGGNDDDGYDDDDNDVISMSCSHRFHESCLVRWMEEKKNSCPLCRKELM